ncbi:MAG: hypothetical protein AAGC88_09325 [Bacteroidota bacterium]
MKATELTKHTGFKAAVIGALFFLGLAGFAKLLFDYTLDDFHLDFHDPDSKDDIGDGFGLE